MAAVIPDKEPELWIKIHKKDSKLPSVTAPEALNMKTAAGRA